MNKEEDKEVLFPSERELLSKIATAYRHLDIEENDVVWLFDVKRDYAQYQMKFYEPMVEDRAGWFILFGPLQSHTDELYRDNRKIANLDLRRSDKNETEIYYDFADNKWDHEGLSGEDLDGAIQEYAS